MEKAKRGAPADPPVFGSRASGGLPWEVALYLPDARPTTLAERNLFWGNDWPVYCSPQVNLGISNIFTGHGLPGNAHNGIWVNGQVWELGSLLIPGSESAPVVWTSHYDDTVLGDTNHDGSATSPAPADNGGLTINGGVLDASYLRPRYAYYGVDTSVNDGSHRHPARGVRLQHHQRVRRLGRPRDARRLHYHDNDPLCDLRFVSDEVRQQYTLTNVTGNVCVE